MIPTIIFDDGQGELGPMTDLRASFEVRTGMLTTAGRIAQAWPRTLAGYWVPAELAPVVAERSDIPVNRLPEGRRLRLVNGRWSRPDAALDVTVGQAAIEASSRAVVMAILDRADAEQFLEHGELPDRVRTDEVESPALYRHPWDVIARLSDVVTLDILSVRLLDAAIPGRVSSIEGGHPVTIHQTAHIHPNVVLDAEQGPIIVHDDAVIRPGAVLCGPCAIGRGATVIDRSLIKANTVIGPRCKVGGEVGATIFQGYANKAHDGHLGDSWVGRWVNFGAGTTNSNLLNTYGEVLMRVEADGPMHRTGLTFLGAIVGDHVKLAIETRIMTGTVIGTGAMIATTAAAPASVRRFAWLTDAGARTYGLDRFLEVMRTVMARRGREPGAAYEQAVRALHGRVGGSPSTADR